MNRFENRLREEGGFTMALVMMTLIFTTMIGLAAYGASQGDINDSGKSRDRKESYAAAEAGLAFYQSRLNIDNAYWAKCTDQTQGVDPVVNNQWNGSGTDPRTWRTVAGTSNNEAFTLELLPATGSTCTSTTLLDSSGTFRVRSTGRFNGVKRSVVGTFSRKRFLDFLYFTNYETTDPLAYSTTEDRGFANSLCADRYRSDRGGTAKRADGTTFTCGEIQFATFDQINGPLHSNDSLLICAGTQFGRAGKKDAIETHSDAPGQYAATGATCTGTTTWNNQGGALATSAAQVSMPDSNSDLATTTGGYSYTGQTNIVFNDDKLTITNNGTTQTNIAYPANGLIYINAGASCTNHPAPRDQTYIDSSGCAIATVTGQYSKDITVASAGDILVKGNLLRKTTSDAVAGLIANEFVRVYHPVIANPTSSQCLTKAANLSSTQGDVQIDAAILTLQHSFTVDNYDCGTGYISGTNATNTRIGTLTVNGAIAQKYRGAVGTTSADRSGNSYNTGYAKNYQYDDRLKFRNPPLFLDPVNAAWKIGEENEQVPAR